MYSNGGQPMVANCTFSGNTGTGSTAYGGGMWNNGSSPTVTNCTFSGNSAYSGGGIYNSDSAVPTVTNCIFWGDTPDEIANSSSTPVVTYSDVQGGWAGTGNINADPVFVDYGDLRLMPFSPCIDAGDTTAVPAGLFVDLDGNGRVLDCPSTDDTGVPAPIVPVTVDMGAYEFQGVPGDLDGDCDVDLSDLAALLANYGFVCP
jgi:predicted outer membrane repeat protein